MNAVIKHLLIALVIVIFLLMLVMSAHAQCSPSNQPTLGLTPTVIQPNQVPLAAVTISYNGSHSLSIGPGTSLTLVWTTYNLGSLPTMSEAEDNGPYKPWFTLGAMSGQTTITYGPQTPTGHVFHDKITGSEKPGSGAFTPTTQDVIDVTIVNQPPGIYSSDGVPSNVYVQVSSTYGGVPNINTNQCPQVYEKDMTPTAQLQLANITTGENRNGVSMNGNTVVFDNNLSSSAFDYISVRTGSNDGVTPGDTINGSVGGVTYCTAFGNAFNGFQSFKMKVELAITFSKITGISNGTASLQDWCKLQYEPPDYDPYFLLNAQTGSTFTWGSAVAINSTWNSGFWLTFPGVAYSVTGPWARQFCTHNPPPY